MFENRYHNKNIDNITIIEYNSQEERRIHVEKFVVKKPEKEVISMRISSDLLKKLDQMAAASDISRNELINQMILFALDHMEEND